MAEQMLEIIPDTTEARRSLDKLAKKIGLDLRDVMIDQGRLLAQDLINRTPPLNKAKKIDEYAGRGAIKADANQVIQVISDSQKTWRIKHAKGDAQIAYKTIKGEVFATSQALYKPNASPKEIDDHIEKFRRSSDRRVTKRRNYIKKIDNWFFVDRLHINASSFRRYLDWQYKDLGKLASGWIPALRYFIRMGKISKKFKVPDFVLRQVYGSGGWEDRLRGDGGGYLRIYNNAKFRKKAIESLYNFALRVRERDMKLGAIKRLEGLVKKFNKGEAWL